MRTLDFEFHIPSDHPSLAGHFPGHPVVPGVLLLDHVLRAMHRLTGRHVVTLKQVKFTSALLPDETAKGSFDTDGARVSFRVIAQRGAVAHAVAEGAGTLSEELIA